MESLGWFEQAARGEWSALAGKEPFGADYPRIDVFVPGAEVYLPENHRKVLRQFDCDSAEELLERYLSGKLDYGADRSEKFVRRKQVSALIQQFSVAVPLKVADKISEKLENRWGDELWFRRLLNPNGYSPRTGLAHCLCEKLSPEEDMVTMMI